MSADATTLRRRLIETLSLDPNAPHEQATYADAIRTARIEGAICARVPAVDGRGLNFSNYFIAVYGVDIDGRVPKEKRGKK
jgi:hypothetical protein